MSMIFDPGPEPWRTIKCAHCAVSFRSLVEFARLEQDHESYWFVEKQLCPECRNFNLFLVSAAASNRGALRPYHDENVVSRRLIRPRGTNRDPIPPEVPSQYAQDYLEACLVLADSPKASAALSRRCLQNLLVHEEKPRANSLALNPAGSGLIQPARLGGQRSAAPQVWTLRLEIFDLYEQRMIGFSRGPITEPFDMPLEQLTLIGLGSRLHPAMGLGEIPPEDVAAIVALLR